MGNDEHVPIADEADRKVWRAVNYFDECADIVRRLVEWHLGPISKHVSLMDITDDAARLWAKMQEEVQRGE